LSNITYTAPKTISRFMQSQSFGRIIAGPVGSSKTTGAMFELLRRACEQEPAADGYRYTRFAVVRTTLKQLRDTVINDIMSWLGEISEYKISESKIFWNFGDVRSEIMFLPLENPEDQKRLLSLQLTGAWLNEGIETPVELISPLAGRLGRYPSGVLGVPTWFGWISDTNMPTEGSPWHKLMTEPPPGIDVFIQPGGMEENAENLEHLVQTPETAKLSLTDPVGLSKRRTQGRKYYERFIAMNSPQWCTRYVHAQFGPDPSGTAVFGSTFKMSFHAVDDLEPVPGTMLIVGQDFGRSPCSVICQVNSKGQLLVLEEIMADDIGLELQIKTRLRPTLTQERYFGCPAVIIGDPAGAAKSTMFEISEFDMLRNEGFAAMKAVTNDIDRRIEAVEKFLLGAVYGEPMFLIDKSRCPQLVRALAGGYRYAYNKAGQRKTTPEKDEASHISDALQYACLASDSNMRNYLQGRVLRRPVRRERVKFDARAWT
jgi:hypothetical protein